ncbi:glycoside hydrolase family 28 protein [Telmatobacter bradus]|uniref:rhamnogalacturonidase n=1 Tax=Telmatobacter bradus TaxID=474953 RepID=UPI003B429B89
MDRRDLLKYSPAIALAASVGHVPLAEAQAPAHAVEAFVNVRTYGATGNGKTVDSPAINKAIEAAAAMGGGTLVFPAGTYLCFTLRLKSHVDLYLSRGCTILAADSPRPGDQSGYNGGTYDAAESNDPWTPYQDYGHNHWHNSLLVADGQHDFSIFGPGQIFGKGLSHGGHGKRGGYDAFVAEQPGVGNKAIALKNCYNVLLRDFSILKGGHFAVLATGVDNLTIDNLLVDTDRDGFDIDCCRNVRVVNCTVNSPWDDGICPKSSYALGYARSTDNVTIANNFVTGGYELGSVVTGAWKLYSDEDNIPRQGRIKCGTESNGGFRNITITGNVMEASKGLALESSDGAWLEDIAIIGNTLRDTIDAPLFLRLNKRNRNPKETLRPGTLRRVLISNLVSYNSNCSTAPFISGLASNLIEDVKITDCYFGHKGLPQKMLTHWAEKQEPMPDWRSIQVPELEDAYPELLQFGPTPAHGLFLRHLKNLELAHVEFAPAAKDPRPALWLQNVHRADFFAITAPVQKNFSLHNVTDLRLAWSRAARDQNVDKAETLEF